MASFLALLVALATAWAGTLRVDMLDVGQGDSILIRTPANKTILIDAGDGDTSVPALLASQGVDHFDLVIATHPHADHIGGMAPVLDALPVKLYVDNGMTHTTATYAKVMSSVEKRLIPYRTAVAGTVFNLDDGARLEILLPNGVPLKDTRSDLNSNSVVARLTHAGHCFLFVGDAEEPTEDALVAAGVGKCDVLKVAHHGSNHSSVTTFLDVVRPSIGLVSVGTRNRYGHPGELSTARLAAAGVSVYRTDLSGQITVLSETGKPLTVRTSREAVASAGVPEPHGAASGVAQNLTPVAAQAVPKGVCPFPASLQSEVFHEAGCGNGEKVLPQNLVCYATREQAIAAGRRPGGCCKP